MNPSYDQVLREAEQLSREEREQLAQRLYESVHGQGDSELEAEWLRIAESRYEAYRAGRGHALTADEFFEQLERSLGWN